MSEAKPKTDEDEIMHSITVLISAEMSTEIARWIQVKKVTGSTFSLTDKVAGALAMAFEKKAPVVNLADVNLFKDS